MFGRERIESVDIVFNDEEEDKNPIDFFGMKSGVPPVDFSVDIFAEGFDAVAAFGNVTIAPDPVQQEVTKISVKVFSDLEEVFEVPDFPNVEDLDEFALNNYNCIEVEETPLQATLDKVLSLEQKKRVRRYYERLSQEYWDNSGKSACLSWPTPLADDDTDGEMTDLSRVEYVEEFHSRIVQTKNTYLYEIYASFKMLDRKKCPGFWSKFWIAFKYLLAFKDYTYYGHEYQKLLIRCPDIYFQQYINFISLIYEWGMVFSFPYVEIKDGREGLGNIVILTPKIYPPGSEMNTGKSPEIGVFRNNRLMSVQVNLRVMLQQLDVLDVFNCCLVSKGFYNGVYEFLKVFNDYSIHLGKYAYGVGLKKIPIRQSGCGLTVYSDYQFGRNHVHPYAQSDDCSLCGILRYSAEMNKNSVDIDPLREVKGYKVDIDVNFEMLNWLEALMMRLPDAFKQIYDNMPRLTAGHFACLYGEVMRSVVADPFIIKFCNYYNKDYLFHILMPYCSGTYNWSYEAATEKGRLLSRIWAT